MSTVENGGPDEAAKHVVIDKPWLMELVRLSSYIGALNIELRTGMRHSHGSVLRRANIWLGQNFRSKEQMRDFMLELKEWAEALYGIEP